MSAFAQEAEYQERGLFGKGTDRSGGGLFGLMVPELDYTEDEDLPGEDPNSGPLGSGIAVLAGLGTAYLIAKKRKEE